MRRKAQLLFAKSSHFELISVLGCASTANSVIQAVERRVKRNASAREIGETFHENFIAVFEIGIMNSPRLFIRRLIEVRSASRYNSEGADARKKTRR